MKHINTSNLLWLVYFALLAVLLPHTAWAFAKFEPEGVWGTGVAWAGAFSFEAAIAVLTHKMARHIESTPKHLKRWTRFTYRYVNSYSVGLVIALSLSVLANLAHAVQFSAQIAIFSEWGIPAGLYSVAFGAALPLTSLLFARVLSNVTDSEEQPDPEIEALKQRNTELQKSLRESERSRGETEAKARQIVAELQAQLAATEQRRGEAEQRFAAADDLFAKLFEADKKVKILTAREKWPQLTPAALAVIAACSPSYVSEVLNERNV